MRGAARSRRLLGSLGVGESNLGNWVRQARIDRGEIEGLTTGGRSERARLGRENAHLRTGARHLRIEATAAGQRGYGLEMGTRRALARAVLWRRLWARVLDTLLAAISTHFPTVALFVTVVVTGFDPFESSNSALGTLWLLVCVLGMLATLLLEAWALSRFGRTLGKRALGVLLT